MLSFSYKQQKKDSYFLEKHFYVHESLLKKTPTYIFSGFVFKSTVMCLLVSLQSSSHSVPAV